MRTMLLEFLKQGRQAMLLYSTRTASEAAFLDELRGLEEKHPSLFRLVVTLTGQDESWAGRKGRIDKSLMAEQVWKVSSLSRILKLPICQDILFKSN